MTQQKPVTWILVADAHHARIWQSRHALTFEDIALVEEMEPSAKHRFGREIRTDQPGRSFSSMGPGRSAVQSHTDPLEAEHQHFAAQLADHLATAAKPPACDRLVIAAAPKMLGYLRAEMAHLVKTPVIKEIDKDLVKANARTVMAELQTAFA
jgi:protein required for attachment to host cells